VKLAAHRAGIPYVCVATAPSMDGYLSANAGLIRDNVKTSNYNLRPAVAVIADAALLATAPFDMIRSGVGDAIGKFSANADWMLSHLVFGDHYCLRSWKMIEKEISALVAMDDAPDSPAFADRLIRTLLITGIVMQMLGHSQPASGSEHHFSHSIEIAGYAESGHAPSSHGLQVALGSAYSMELYRRFFEEAETLDFTPAQDILSGVYVDEHIAEWKRFDVDLSKQIREKQEKMKSCAAILSSLTGSALRSRLRPFFERYDEIVRMYENLPLPRNYSDIGIDEGRARFGVAHGVDLRMKFTITDLYHVLGLLDERCDEVLR
jgi:glycerol-1-phosphate dehydrogenase [NAD(P)+]